MPFNRKAFKDFIRNKLDTEERMRKMEDARVVLAQGIFEIGDWNMDLIDSVQVSHGLSDFKKIRHMSAIIRDDSDSPYYSLEGSDQTGAAGGIIYVSGANITLERVAGGKFDGANFNATSYNRGWVMIWYSAT